MQNKHRSWLRILVILFAVVGLFLLGQVMLMVYRFPPVQWVPTSAETEKVYPKRKATVERKDGTVYYMKQDEHGTWRDDPEAEPLIDTDGDGLFDDEEPVYGADPLNPDTDGDGVGDGEEINFGLNPNGPGRLRFED